MTIHLNRATAALQLALSKTNAELKYTKADGWSIYVHGLITETNFKNYGEAEKRCIQLNNEYIVGKVLESLKGEAPDYSSDTMWIRMNSRLVWNLCINEILRKVKFK